MDRRMWNEPVDERIVAEGLELRHREMLRITGGAGLLVAAQSGMLWLTEEGKPSDFFVGPGRCYRIESDALAVAMALEPASVTLSAPLAAPATFEIERVTADGTTAARVRGAKRGTRIGRALTAAWLKLYRKGARAARRAQLARLAAGLDARTRSDIGLAPYEGWLTRAEQTRWLHDLHGPSRHGTFL